MQKLRILGPFCVLLCLFGACKKNKNNKEDSASSAVEQAKQEKLKSSGAVDLMRIAPYLMDKTRLIFGINLKTLRESSSFKDNEDQLKSRLPKELGDIESICGFSPLDALTNVVVATNTFDEADDDRKFLAWGAGLERTKFESCAKTVLAKDQKKFLMTEKDGIHTYQVEEESFDIAWLSDNEFLISPESAHREWFQKRIKKVAGLDTIKPKLEVMAKIDVSQGIWFGALQDQNEAELEKAFEAMPIQGSKGIYGSLGLNSGLHLKGSIVFDADSSALTATTESNKKLTELAESMAMFASYVNKLKVVQNKNEMSFSYDMSTEELEQVTNMAKSQMAPPAAQPVAPQIAPQIAPHMAPPPGSDAKEAQIPTPKQ